MGSTLDLPDQHGHTPLSHAERAGHRSLLHFLRDRAGSFGNRRPSETDIPAAYQEVLKQVESSGWDAVTWKDGYTMLHWAASKGRHDLCDHLLRLRADPADQDKFERTPLDCASQAGHDEVVRRLSVWDTLRPSLATARSGSFAASDLTRPATVRPPLLRPSAAERPVAAGRKLSEFEPFSARGVRADIHRASEPIIGRSVSANLDSPRALSAEKRASLPASYLDVMQQIDRVGWDKMQWAHGFTLLHWAARSGDVELCRRFLAQRGDPNHCDDAGRSAIDYAQTGGHAAVIAELRTAAAAST